MKQFLFLFVAVIGLAVQSFAQSATLIPLAAGDTVSNTGTASKIIPATAGYSGIAIQAKATKLTGTNAGTIKVQGSLDGTNFTDIGSAYTVTDVATQSTMFYVAAPLATKIRVIHTGSGTMSSVLQVRYVLRRYTH